MTSATSTEFKNHFGEYLERARQEPISIERNGRPSAVLISSEEFERLTKLEDQIWGERAMRAKEAASWISAEESVDALMVMARDKGIEF